MMIGQEHVQINSRIPDGFNIDHFNECFILMDIMDMHIMYIHCQRPKALLKLGSLSSQSDHENNKNDNMENSDFNDKLHVFSLSPRISL